MSDENDQVIICNNHGPLRIMGENVTPQDYRVLSSRR